MEQVWPLRGAKARPSAVAEERALPPSLRTLSASMAVLIGLLAIAAVGALIWSGVVSRRALAMGVAATQSQAYVDEAFLASLTHRRLSDLWVVTGEPELERAREEIADDARRALERGVASAHDDGERALYRVADRQLEAYLAQRAELEATTRDLPTILTEGRGAVDRLSETLAALRRIDRRHAEAAYRELRRATLIADVVGGGLAALLLGALLLILFSVRRWLAVPLLELHGALRRFRRGDLDARAPERGARELCDVAHAYNRMADELVAQRRGQLTYLAGVAHDLRNPLATLEMGLNVIECYEGTDRSRQTMSLMHRQVGRLSRMVDDLLDLTRIEAGKLELRPEPIDLRDHARDTAALYQPSAPTHQIVLELPDEPRMIHADPGRVDQVLNNLVSNALKFSPQGGTVYLRCERERAGASVSVRDHGIGMNKEEMRDMFAPFRRRAPGVAPGAGLGLSVVRRIVEAHGGSVQVESERGKGTTFRVLFPAVHEEGAVHGGRPDRG